MEDYLSFLKAGRSADPQTLLSIAGVDPLKEETYRAAMDYFKGLVDEYERLVDAKIISMQQYYENADPKDVKQKAKDLEAEQGLSKTILTGQSKKQKEEKTVRETVEKVTEGPVTVL